MVERIRDIKVGDLVHLSCDTTHRGVIKIFENGIVISKIGSELEVYWPESGEVLRLQRKHLELLDG